MAETTARRRHKKSGLPNEIVLYHIASRLPAKSVIRLMTVSKEFYSFLNTRKFAKMHLHHVTNDYHPNHDKLLVLSTQKPLFTTIDCESPDQDLTLPNRPLPFLPRCPPYARILTSNHGLVCIGLYHEHEPPRLYRRYDRLILWNPLTGDYKILTNGYLDYDISQLFGLYYSSCDDDYKLLHITTKRRAYLYSLKSDSWNWLFGLTSEDGGTYSIRSAWLNENLYFLKTCPVLSILRFDTKTEKFAEITTPSNLSSLVDNDVKSIYLTVHRGCIHLCVIYDGMRRFIVMKNEADGVWTKVRVPKVHGSMWRLHRMRKGNWLMISTSEIGTTYLWKANPKKKAYTYLGTLTGDVAIPDEGRYTETLVSLNQYRNMGHPD